MGYYDERIKVFNVIEARLKKAKAAGIEIDLMIYDLTQTFKIGESTITNRIDLLKKLNKIELLEGLVIWKQ